MTTKKTSTMIATMALVLAGSAFAADPVDTTDHDTHHPAGTTSATKAPTAKVKTATSKAAPAIATMDTKIQAMQDMHEKMAAAKTPEERNALMGEHMKTMQDAMGTMDSMGMMGGMGGKGGVGMGGGMQGQMPLDMATRQQMMEKRMEMMGSMMQMMMDRMAPAPATK